jgi:hypothetical protein
MQWRAWIQCFALIFTGSLFSTVYYVLAIKYVALQKATLPGSVPDAAVVTWVVCLVWP